MQTGLYKTKRITQDEGTNEILIRRTTFLLDDIQRLEEYEYEPFLKYGHCTLVCMFNGEAMCLLEKYDKLDTLWTKFKKEQDNGQITIKKN